MMVMMTINDDRNNSGTWMYRENYLGMAVGERGKRKGYWWMKRMKTHYVYTHEDRIMKIT
jgi:hypothetical protein